MFCNAARTFAERDIMRNRQIEIEQQDRALEAAGVPEGDQRRAALAAEFVRLERLCDHG